jgi:DNA processing protein
VSVPPASALGSFSPYLSREKEELVALLSLPGMSAARLSELLTLFGSPAGAWDAIVSGAADRSASVASGWRDASKPIHPGELARRRKDEGIQVTVSGETGYPGLLAQTHDPPVALFHKGNLPGHAPCVAIVGSRKATSYGLEVSRWLAEGLAREGVCVVSGAAYGIDSAAHRGAIEADGLTCGVLGCGVDIVYPRTNAGLFDKIVERGCLVSEYVPGTEPRPHFFPARNRIIAGLAKGVIVVEASARSGALITADLALSENREVCAVPGQVFSSNSDGTHSLIRAGAALVTSPGEVLAELGLSEQSRRPEGAFPDATDVSAGEKALLDALEGGPCDVEGLALEVGLAAHQAIAALSLLEVRGLIVRGAGGMYQKRGP